MEWIAVGTFADAAPLAAAATELILVGVPPSDLCLAGLPVSMQRVATAAEVRSVDRVAHLLKGAVEVRLAGSEDAILAVPSCLGNPSSFFSPAIADRLRGPISEGCILLGARAPSAADAATAARVLLRHSLHHVHMLQCPPRASGEKSL